MPAYILPFLVMITCSVSGNLLLKLGASASYARLFGPFSWLSFIGLGLFGFGVLFYGRVLQILPLHMAQSIMAIQYALIVFCAHFVLGEPLHLSKWIGVGFVLVGLYFLNRSPL